MLMVKLKPADYLQPAPKYHIWVFPRTLLCGVEYPKIVGMIVMIVMSSTAVKAPVCTLFSNIVLPGTK